MHYTKRLFCMCLVAALTMSVFSSTSFAESNVEADEVSESILETDEQIGETEAETETETEIQTEIETETEPAESEIFSEKGTEQIHLESREGSSPNETAVTLVIASGSCGSNLTWSFDSLGVFQMNGTGSMTNYGSVSAIPWDRYQGLIKKIVISEGVTGIGEYAFYECAAQTIQLPNSLQTIGKAAFWNLTNISTFTIPKNVTYIEAGAFSGSSSSSSLQNITVADGNTRFISVDGVLYSKDKKSILAFPCGRSGNYSVPSGTTEVGAYAFCGAMKTNTITLPTTVKSIGECAFHKTGVTDLVIPEGVSSIGERAFGICSNLQSVTIKGPVSRISDNLFMGCTALKSITLPKTVNYIGHDVFWDCSSLSNVYYTGTKEEWNQIEKNSEVPSSAVIHYSTGDSQGGNTSPSVSFPYAAPVLTKVENVNGGVRITWGKVTGAAKYRVFRKTGTGNWAKVADTTAVTYTDKTAVSGTKYTYTVRCLSSDGKVFTSSFDAAGKSITYIAAPVLSKVENVDGGVKITWGKVTGAEKYRVYRKTGSGSWAKVGDTTAVTYTDKTAVSGTKYTYTVRCISSDGKVFTSSFDATGKSITYIAAPAISKLENINGGVKITWGKVTGAARYRVYRKTGSGSWAKVGDTTAVTYTDKTAVSGTKYAYTIRCISSDGKAFTSSFNATGKSITYIAAPAISKAENVNGGVKITWGKVTGAARYRVYRKTGSGSWAKVGDTTAVTYTDKTAVSGTKYTYTVRCISSDGKAFTSSFNATGKSITYIAAPVISKVENVSGGIKITWGRVTGAAKYRVYRKTAGGSWAKVGDTTAVTFTDKTAKCGTTYTYTVRCISSDAKSFTSSFDSTGKSVSCTNGWRQLYINYINKIKSTNSYQELCLIYIDGDEIPELYMPSPVAVSVGKICWIQDGKVAEQYCGDYIGYNDRSGNFYSLRIHSGMGVLNKYKLSNGKITTTEVATYGSNLYKWEGKEISGSQWWSNLESFEKGYSARVNTYVSLDEAADYVKYISATFKCTGKWVIDEWQTEPRLPGNKTLTDVFGSAYNHKSYMNINKDRTIEYYICAGHSGKGTYYIQNGHTYANITRNNTTETVELILISEEDTVVWIKTQIEGYQIYWEQSE